MDFDPKVLDELNCFPSLVVSGHGAHLANRQQTRTRTHHHRIVQLLECHFFISQIQIQSILSNSIYCLLHSYEVPEGILNVLQMDII